VFVELKEVVEVEIELIVGVADWMEMVVVHVDIMDKMVVDKTIVGKVDVNKIVGIDTVENYRMVEYQNCLFANSIGMVD
jgi:hypothetical protein